MTATDSKVDGLFQRRLFYADRCDDLGQALQFMASVLRNAPAGGGEVREALARRLATGLPESTLEADFARIDAVWAAWTRPENSTRNREAVERHERMALLAAVDQAVVLLRVHRVQRALARRRLGRPLDVYEETLITSPEADAAAAMLEGKPYSVLTVYGILQCQPVGTTQEKIADAELLVPSLVRWLVEQNGCRDLAPKLTDQQAERLVEAWPKHAGRPRKGQTANWDVITQTLVDLGIPSPHVRKEWEAFRRNRGSRRGGALRST